MRVLTAIVLAGVALFVVVAVVYADGGCTFYPVDCSTLQVMSSYDVWRCDFNTPVYVEPSETVFFSAVSYDEDLGIDMYNYGFGLDDTFPEEFERLEYGTGWIDLYEGDTHVINGIVTPTLATVKVDYHYIYPGYYVPPPSDLGLWVCPNLLSGTEVTYDWYDAGCESATVSCDSTDNPRIYANGLQIGRCISTPLTFNSRPQMTNTITLLDESEFTANVNVACQSTMGAMSPAEPLTGTVLGLSEPSTVSLTSGQIEVLGGSGFLGIDFGGDLSDPNSPVNRWLGYGTDFINVVNSGNLLYIIAAIGVAGAVLSWAIHQIRNPGSW